METTGVTLAVTSSEVLRYAAAFFFVLVAIAIAVALFKVAKTLGRVDQVLADVDQEVVPLMRKAGVTLDGVNANLNNVDDITKDVADITDKIDTMANTVEGMVTGPARKAAALSAGLQTAVSSFMRRDRGAAADQDVPVTDDGTPIVTDETWMPADADVVQPGPATHEPATRDPLTEPSTPPRAGGDAAATPLGG